MIVVNPKEWRTALEKENAVLVMRDGGPAKFYADNGEGEEMRIHMPSQAWYTDEPVNKIYAKTKDS